VVSIQLFLSVGYFTDSLKKSIGMAQEGIQFDITVLLPQDKQEEIVAEIASLETIKEYSIMQNIDLRSWIDKDQVAYLIMKYAVNDEHALVNNQYPYHIQMHMLDEHSFENYAATVGVDWTAYNDPKNVRAIVVDTVQSRDNFSEKYVEAKAIKMNI